MFFNRMILRTVSLESKTMCIVSECSEQTEFLRQTVAFGQAGRLLFFFLRSMSLSHVLLPSLKLTVQPYGSLKTSLWYHCML